MNLRKPTSPPLPLRDLRKPTSPPLTLRVFSKTHQSSLTLKGGSTAFPKPLFSWRRLAALGNMKANFHCAHLHNLSPQGTGDVPTALLGAFFRKPTRPSLPLRKAPHLSPSLSLLRRERMCQPPYSVLKPLRYKVGGPSEVYASSGAADFCAGMNPLSLKDLLKGCLLVAFFENPPVFP